MALTTPVISEAVVGTVSTSKSLGANLIATPVVVGGQSEFVAGITSEAFKLAKRAGIPTEPGYYTVGDTKHFVPGGDIAERILQADKVLNDGKLAASWVKGAVAAGTNVPYDVAKALSTNNVTASIHVDKNGTHTGELAITSVVPIIQTSIQKVKVTSTSIETGSTWVDTSHYETQLVSNETNFVNNTNIPFIRENMVLLHGTGMKPFTTVYGMLDGIETSQYMVQCPELILTGAVGTFLGVKKETYNTESAEARTNEGYSVNFTAGEVINGTTTGSVAFTIICVANYLRLSSDNTLENVLVYLSPTNISPTSATLINSTLIGKTSKSTATVSNYYYYDGESTNVVKPTSAQTVIGYTTAGAPIYGAAKLGLAGSTYDVTAINKATLSSRKKRIREGGAAKEITIGAGSGYDGGTTDQYGNIFTRLYIPGNKFKTGTVPILVTDNVSNPKLSLTKSAGSYFAQGTQHNYENVITNHKYWVSSGYTNNWSRTVTSSTYENRTVNKTIGYDVVACANDPLAQTFTLPDTFKNGVFVHSVDLYFHSGSDNLPVTIQIVDVINGYPAFEHFASVVLQPTDLNMSSTSLVATRATFDKLIYLKPGKEYAIKILSNSNKYKVWVSKMGEVDLLTKTLIAKQPSLGSLFMSQNNSTWSADQLRDLAYQLNIAKFDTTKTGIFDTFPIRAVSKLPPNPFFTTLNSTTVRVTHYNHNLMAGNYVSYRSSTDTRFNTSYKVDTVTDSDHYTISLDTVASVTASIGGAEVCVPDSQYRSDVMRIYANNYTPPGTTLNAAIKPTYDDLSISSSYQNLPINTYVKMMTPTYIMSRENEIALLNHAQSLTTQLQLTSNDQYMSPVVDLSTFGIVNGSTRINTTTVDDINNTIFNVDVSELGHSTSTSFSIAAGAVPAYITTTINIRDIKIGNYILVWGAGETANNTHYLVTDINYTQGKIYLDKDVIAEVTGSDVYIGIYNLVSDPVIASGDTHEAVYVTIPVTLSNVSTGIKILLDSAVPANADVRIFYRATSASSSVDISKLQWVELETNDLSSGTIFIEREYVIDNLSEFDVFQVKILFESANSSSVPEIKNLRIIALA